MRNLLIHLALLITTLPVASAAGPTLYDIEVLVFENRQPSLEGGETWKESRKEIAELDRAALPEAAPTPDSALSQAIGGLERGGQHRVLVHRRWQQTAGAKTETAPLRLQSTGRGLDGTMRFYLNRFLYVEMDLVLRGLNETYPLTEHRRVRPQEVQYFDHPRLGALVRITALDKSEVPKPAPRVKKPQ